MQWRIKKCLVLALVLTPSLCAAEQVLKITVFVYNYAEVSGDVLAQSEAEAGGIYQLVGIGIAWLDCPLSPDQAGQYPACQVPPGPTRLVVRVLSRVMAERMRQPEDTFGFALQPGDGTFGMVANVFSFDAEELAKRRGMSHGVILGHLMAHELGHLLLGTGGHAASGIMHVPWHRKELEIITQGLMLFGPAEGEKMRAQIHARMAGRQASLVIAK